MAVQIGQSADHSFDQPIGLLTDCHRRIEKFLAALLEVAASGQGKNLDERSREALEKSLRYFKNAAPWHTDDEEASLFPRLRDSDDPKVHELLARVEQLEADHRQAEQKHAQVEHYVQKWLDTDTLPSNEAAELLTLLHSLQATYAEHIAFEDEQVFPLAKQVLTPNQLKAMGREMAQRRGVDPGMPARRCKHSRFHPPATQ